MSYEDTAAGQGLAKEEAPSLADIASPEEGAGAWPKGWYRGRIVIGYTTGRGKQMETGDSIAKNQSSRNLRLCVELDGSVYTPSTPDPSKRVLTKGPGGTRNIQNTLNYKPENVSAQGVANVKAAFAQYKNTQSMPKDLQSLCLSLGRIGQLEKAMGFKLPFVADAGRFDVAPFVGHQVDVRLSISDEGFSDIEAFAPFGSHVK